MITETKREPEMGLTFEKVWAMFQETDRKFQETDRQLKETDRQLKETDRKIGKLGGRLGELVEHLVAPNILEKFNALGYVFGRAGANVRFVDKNNRTIAEVDILLENGDLVLAVEVKSKLSTENVQEHMERMEKLRRYADDHGDLRKLIGAVAGAVIPEGVKPFALKNGLYVLEQAGDTVKIEVPEGFKPREW
ncbi:MAG: hypothetical protein LBQ44_05755 [Treponema sp.]|jgi:hypothetical protein|nr:hypothetical protein [Treponema sp.]